MSAWTWICILVFPLQSLLFHLWFIPAVSFFPLAEKRDGMKHWVRTAGRNLFYRCRLAGSPKWIEDCFPPLCLSSHNLSIPSTLSAFLLPFHDPLLSRCAVFPHTYTFHKLSPIKNGFFCLWRCPYALAMLVADIGCGSNMFPAHPMSMPAAPEVFATVQFISNISTPAH